MNQEKMLTIVLGPHISEKSSVLSEKNNQVTFRVARNATKPEIKKAIEGLFNVEVKEVQVMNVKGKRKRSPRGIYRTRPTWKKAYIRLEQGHAIDFADMG